jgi:pyruvate,water dikinase
MSDFKSNEYANLIGGKYFEPHEENPMIGFGCFPLLQRFYRKGCPRMRSDEKSETKWGSQRKTDDSFCRTVEEGEKYWQKWPPITG